RELRSAHRADPAHARGPRGSPTVSQRTLDLANAADARGDSDHQRERYGDNDTLGAMVTNLIEADVLVLLTDQSGLYTADPRRETSATLVTTARAGDPQLEAMAGGAGTSHGRGGMLTKVLAAK